MKSRRRKRKYVYKGRAKVIAVLLLLLLAVAIFLFNNHNHTPETTDGRTAAYLPAWDYRCYSSLDYDSLTDVILAFANPYEDELHIEIPENDLKKIIRKAHRHDVRVSISIGGGGNSSVYAELLKSRSSRKELVSDIMAFAGEYHLDGIDLNIEGDVDESMWKNYGDFVSRLKKSCTADNLILSCAIATWFDGHIDSSTLDQFDFISVMAYDDMSGYNHATYDYAVQQMEYFSDKRKIDEDRLLLGIPFYGYRYENGICTGEAVTFGEIAKYNEGGEHGDESGTCRYNGIDTVKQKTQLAENYGGVMIWSINQDAQGEYSLLRAISEAKK